MKCNYFITSQHQKGSLCKHYDFDNYTQGSYTMRLEKLVGLSIKPL